MNFKVIMMIENMYNLNTDISYFTAHFLSVVDGDWLFRPQQYSLMYVYVYSLARLNLWPPGGPPEARVCSWGKLAPLGLCATLCQLWLN